jgi:phospholipase C
MSKRKPPRAPAATFDPSRRRFLGGVAASTAVLALPGCGSSIPAAPMTGPDYSLPPPRDSGIDHFVVVMMENRSFDHFLGWVPGADGAQAGRIFPNVNGVPVPTFHLASDPAYGYQGCGWADPNHNYDGGRIHLDGGRMDGWLLTSGTKDNPADRFPVGYYTGEDLPFFKGVAQNFTVCDRYFHGFLGPTYPNRFYMHAGQTDRNTNSSTTSTLPTIWDRLKNAGLAGRYYYNDLPVTALWGDAHLDISMRYEQFKADCAAGQLPDVSIIDPRFLGESPQGVSNDDHPQADVRNGQAFLNEIYNTLRASSQWERSLMVVCYDEWGGFYDHVVPPMGPVTAHEYATTGNDGTLGFRVPCVILGPRARRGYVAHQTFDVNSILNMICWRFGLETLGARGETSANLALALDLAGAPNPEAPDFGVAAGPFGQECSSGLPAGAANASFDSHNAEWLALRDKAIASGFKLD